MRRAPWALTPLAIASPASAQPQFAANNLISVQISNVANNNEILSRNNIAVQAAVQLIANVCPNVNVSQVALLAVAQQQQELTQMADCDADGTQETVLNFAPAQRPGGRG